MPVRLCLAPTCSKKATRDGRCARHQAEYRDATRSPNVRFYWSAAWRRTRRRQLAEFPLCQNVIEGEMCGAVAEHVHHRLPIEEGGAKRDPANLMSVCNACHGRIHKERDRRRRARVS